MFFDSEITIYRFLIGMKKKNLFNVKYVRVYLMLNALKMKSFDYKSIALPAELQGRFVIDASIRPKNYISQYKKSYLSCSALLRFAAIVAKKVLEVTHLSVWESVWDLQSYSVWISHHYITSLQQ